MMLTFALTVAGAVQAQEQPQSDYEIQENFRNQIETLQQQVETVSTSQEADSIRQRIASLETHYADHESLINRALYPETYREKITQLKKRISTTHKRLARIEQQDETLKQLTIRLNNYSKRLIRLDNRTDSLKIAVSESKKTGDELQQELEYYRQQLEQRDQLILSFIDSVVITYQNLGIDSMPDIENRLSKSRLSSGENPLQMIRSIPAESIQLLDSEESLAPEEYLRMKTVHQEYAAMWNKVGHKLTEVYSVNPSQVESEVQQSINRWEKALNDKLWAAMLASFRRADIDIRSFENADAFYEALETYVEQGLAASRKDSGRKSYEQYARFADFWNDRVKGEWIDKMIRTDLITNARLVTIDRKTSDWASVAKPESNLFAYLLGMSVLAIAVLGFLLFREKSGSGSKKKTS